MKNRVRHRGWSSAAEPFRYDFSRLRFVSDEREPGRLNPSDRGNLREYCVFILGAVSELRREFEIESADEWESGHLLMLYASVRSAESAIEAESQAPNLDASKQDDDEFSFLRRRITENLEVSRKYRCLERLFGEVTYVCEIVVTRHWPSALPRLVAEVAGSSPKKTDRLNRAVKEMGLHDIARLRSVVNIWLHSFDRSYSFDFRNDIEQFEQLSLWIEACLDGVRHVLSNAGPAIQKMTRGLV